METREWEEWHRAYGHDPARDARLEAVRAEIREFLDLAGPGTIRVLSLCAGDGRDLLGVLASHPRSADVTGRLLDLEAALVEAGRENLERWGLTGLEFRRADAALVSSYEGARPADLVLVCGVFGNLSDEDVDRTVAHLSVLCAPGASVLWTRSRVAPDLTPRIRLGFATAGFEEIRFRPIPDSLASVGHHRLRGPARTDAWIGPLFRFLPLAERPTRRGAEGVSS